MPSSALTPAPARRRPGRWAALALVVAAAALSAACSTGSGTQAGPGNSPVASLAGHSNGSGAAGQPLTKAQSDQDMVNFARCMRAHGVQMSDPAHIPGHSGLSIDMPTRDSATSAAYGACDHPMLDPTAEGQLSLGNVPGITSDFGRYSPQFRAADHTCRHLLPAGVQDDGTGP